MHSDLRTRVLLSVQRALLGEITPEMRAIETEWSAERIILHVFTEGVASAEARDDFDAVVVTQVLADFTDLQPIPQVDFEFVRCDAPARIPVHGYLVFARAGVGADTVAPAT